MLLKGFPPPVFPNIPPVEPEPVPDAFGAVGAPKIPPPEFAGAGAAKPKPPAAVVLGACDPKRPFPAVANEKGDFEFD